MGFYTSFLCWTWVFLVGTDMVLVIFVPIALDTGPGIRRCSVDEGQTEPCDLTPPHICVIQGDTVLALTH